RRGCPVILLRLHAVLRAWCSPPANGGSPPPVPPRFASADARSWAGRRRARSAPSGRATEGGCPARRLSWPRSGRSRATTPRPPVYIDRCISLCREPACLTVSSCGFLRFLTLSPLSVKSGQSQSDTLTPFHPFPIRNLVIMEY